MTALPRIPAALLARQTPAVRAQLAAATKRAPPSVTVSVTREGGALVIVLDGLAMPNISNIGLRACITAKCRQKAALLPVLACLRPPPLPLRVTITRIAPKALDVGDNATISGKKVRDLLSRWIGVDDKTDDVVAYEVRQETGPVACRIVVAPMNPAPPAGV